MPQFELESQSSYVGTYADNLVSGSLVTRFPNGTVTTGSRGRTGGRLGGDEAEYTTATSLHDLADRFYGRQTIKSGFKRSVDFFSVRERFYDTLVPDFVGITSTNNAKFLSPLFYNAIYGFTVPTLKLIITVKGAGITGSNSATISDNFWWHTFPFEYRYRDVYRIPSLNNAETINGYVEDKVPARDLVDSGSLHWANVGSSASYTNEVTRSANYTISLVVGDNTAASPPENLSMYNFLDRQVTSISPTDPATINYSVSGLFKHLEPVWFSRLYYGYFKSVPLSGSGFANGPPGNVYAPGAELEAPIAVFFSGSQFTFKTLAPPRPDGWKYGLMNGLPVHNKCSFRVGRFGQPRDMLEQRLFTKFYDGETQTDAVVGVSFLPATPHYVTASDQSLNTRGSGIYDLECKASRPWFDV